MTSPPNIRAYVDVKFEDKMTPCRAKRGDSSLINYLERMFHWLGAYRTYALYSGQTFVRFNDLEDVFT